MKAFSICVAGIMLAAVGACVVHGLMRGGRTAPSAFRIGSSPASDPHSQAFALSESRIPSPQLPQFRPNQAVLAFLDQSAYSPADAVHAETLFDDPAAAETVESWLDKQILRDSATDTLARIAKFSTLPTLQPILDAAARKMQPAAAAKLVSSIGLDKVRQETVAEILEAWAREGDVGAPVEWASKNGFTAMKPSFWSSVSKTIARDDPLYACQIAGTIESPSHRRGALAYVALSLGARAVNHYRESGISESEARVVSAQLRGEHPSISAKLDEEIELVYGKNTH